MQQYQVVLVNLDPTVGHEIKKTRPCVVISPDEMNRHLATLLIAPMTTKSRSYPTRVEAYQGSQKSWVALDQIRTIDKKRVVKRFEFLSSAEQLTVKRVLKQMLVD
jgi:mRNA interferase MazF